MTLQEERPAGLDAAPAEGRDELSRLRTENAQLRDTVVALREELERHQAAHEEGVQRALAAASEEVAQLRATVAALREAMERLKFEGEEEARAIQRRAREESAQLQETVRLLRERLGEGEGRGA
jgi:chromosome segregation ATPase